MTFLEKSKSLEFKNVGGQSTKNDIYPFCMFVAFSEMRGKYLWNNYFFSLNISDCNGLILQGTVLTS